MKSQLTFDLFLSMIPARSSNPTVYLPRFAPSCAPDKALNPTTEAFIFHFPSFTSIQWAVNPRNPIFVVSADHPSCVIDTFPGAAFAGTYYLVSLFCFEEITITYNYFSFNLFHIIYELIMEMYLDVVGTRKVRASRFRSHRDKSISECKIIGKCQGL